MNNGNIKYKEYIKFSENMYRYERSRERLQPTGRAVVQRHVALPEEIANKEGRGLLVLFSGKFKTRTLYFIYIYIYMYNQSRGSAGGDRQQGGPRPPGAVFLKIKKLVFHIIYIQSVTWLCRRRSPTRRAAASWCCYLYHFTLYLFNTYYHIIILYIIVISIVSFFIILFFITFPLTDHPDYLESPANQPWIGVVLLSFFC